MYIDYIQGESYMNDFIFLSQKKKKRKARNKNLFILILKY